MKTYDIIIIGGGVAGMQAALTASESGLSSVIIDKANRLGGKMVDRNLLFPTFTPASEVIGRMKIAIEERGIKTYLNCNVKSINSEKSSVEYEQTIEERVIYDTLEAKTIIIATGYEVFDAKLKQEYGYTVYDNVYSSAELEIMLRDGKILTKDGRTPESVAFIHCVGSRDVKVGNEHCSRVCCVTGVKQAIEVCKSINNVRVFNYYMDMRMFGIGYEEMYKSAQQDYQIRFIRGRVSELSQNIDKRVRLKAEDTLIARPIAITVDMVILLVGMCGAKSNKQFAESANLSVRDDGFLRPINEFEKTTYSDANNIFYAGCVESPKNVSESMNHATMAVMSAKRYINSL